MRVTEMTRGKRRETRRIVNRKKGNNKSMLNKDKKNIMVGLT